ncbi:MAG: nitroreductase family protein [Candidatus Thermoplasmatota archaeon]|nr:nitroreductase family protein [Candidatus Thermoplasmatota archaeon]
MELIEVINKRRAFRSIDKTLISEELINDLAECARLSASCFNNQPWRYVFVYDSKVIGKMHNALSSGNEWAKRASMIVVVCSKKEDDCLIKDREYYLFDTGMATAFLILRATELGLVAHPIAGYSPKKTREILNIPDEMNVITLVIVGKHSDKIHPELSEKQIQAEKKRPKRKEIKKFVYMNKWKGNTQ